jgi:hypothetical protein
VAALSSEKRVSPYHFIEAKVPPVILMGDAFDALYALDGARPLVVLVRPLGNLLDSTWPLAASSKILNIVFLLGLRCESVDLRAAGWYLGRSAERVYNPAAILICSAAVAAP